MVLVEVNAVMMLTTSVTTTTRMLAVFALNTNESTLHDLKWGVVIVAKTYQYDHVHG